MGEEAAAAATAPRSSAASSFSSSYSSLRFLGLLKQLGRADPNPKPNPNLELDESDVVWSSSAAPAAAAADEDPYSFDSSTSPPSSSAAAAYSPSDHLRRRHFVPERFGLSALLADDAPPPRPPGAARPMPLPAPAPDEKVRNGFRQSAPVAVPVWPKRRERRSAMDAAGYCGEEGRGKEEDGEEEEEGEMVPPHVIVARSHATRLSVLEGAGRTLKGRDLRRVRNAVLRKTGFLDL
ncbi:hypothetical protein ACMD2_08689 [Ananas comosus]|uniref:Senescence regulator n=1 Tax=Ananas comosus TaxID=4615 RepID=A0A199VB30_ANACO|nr:hypothetical protein ACMD2_08689 [Ananas comosus]